MNFVLRLSNLTDLRYMAAREEFIGLRGRIMSRVGAFPVDRKSPSLTTIRHSMELMKEGKGLVIFGEGKMFGNDLVHPLKPGIGMIVTRTGAEAVIPIAMHYRPSEPGDCSSREKIAGFLASAGIVAAGIAACVAGPLARTAVTGITGALAGAYLAGSAAGRSNKGDPTFGPLLKRVMWGAIGGVTGAVLGAASAAFLPALAPYIEAPLAVIAGRALFQGARHMQNREVVEVEVAKPIEVQPYLDKYGKKDAPEHLLADVHQSLCEAKAHLVNGAGHGKDGSGQEAGTTQAV